LRVKTIYMLKYIGRKRLIILLLFISVLSGIIFLPIIYSLSDHLSKTARVNANILLVEGWLPPYAIEEASNEFHNKGYTHIITTGLNSPEYYMVSMNGYLIFYPKRVNSVDNELPVHVIEIDAYSELGGINSSRFNVYVNDSLISEFSADKRIRKYEISWEGKLTSIDSVMVQFINDKMGDFGDRNLYVKEVIIDNKIKIPYQNYSEYDISKLDGKRRIINNFGSYAQLARSRLLSMGIDSSFVTAVPGKRVKINRTLTSALAFRDWLDSSDIEIKGINVITMGTHARRTWMTYNKILNGRYDVGIISLPDYRDSYSRKHKILKTFRELFGLIYYWLILIPY
jgi:hypothetical protein